MQEEEDDMEFVPWGTDDNESTSSGTAVGQSKGQNTGKSISHRSFSGGSSPPNSHHSTTDRPFHGSATTDYWERSNDFFVKAKRVVRPCLVEGFFLVKRYKVVALLFLLFSLSYLFLRTQGSPGKSHDSEKQRSEEQTLILELKDDISTLTASYEQEKERIKQLVEQLRRLQEKELEDREREEKLRRELSQSEMERRDLEERQREEKVRKMQSEYEHRIEQMKENEKKKLEELVKEAEEQNRVFREELKRERLEGQANPRCDESNKQDLEDALRTARQKELELETKISKITAEAEERESNLQQRLQELRQDVISSKKEAREAKERLLQNLDEQSALTREKRNTEKVEKEEGEEVLPKPFVRRDSRQGWSLDLSDEVTDSMDDGVGGNAHEEEEEEEEEPEQDEENIGEKIEGSNSFVEVTKINPDQDNLFGEHQLKTAPQRSKPSLGLEPEEEEEEEEETKAKNFREVLFFFCLLFFSPFSFYSYPFESRSV